MSTKIYLGIDKRDGEQVIAIALDSGDYTVAANSDGDSPEEIKAWLAEHVTPGWLYNAKNYWPLRAGSEVDSLDLIFEV